jgi:hypothetical protein
MSNEPILCYVRDQWAFFTTRKLSEQWGDDWNDAPYEHNAGDPYEFGAHDEKNGREPWTISRVAFDGCFETPCSNYPNSPWSVEQINAGAVAWLRSSYPPITVIPAGVTLPQFRQLIERGGGTVYFPTPRE